MKTNTKINKILISLLLLVTINSSYADDQLDVKTRVNNMQNATSQIWILWEIFTKIFDTNGKIKEAFLSITNTATNGYIPMWDNLQLIDSPIYYLAWNIGIGTTNPSQALEVNGNLHISWNITLSGGIDGNSIYNSSINTDKIADNTISSNDIADNTISSADISDNSITSNDISDNSITSNDISDGTISSNDIADNTITETDINDSFVARDSSLLDWKDSTTTIWSDDTTIPTSKAIKDFIALLWLDDLIDAIASTSLWNLFLWLDSWIDTSTWSENTWLWLASLSFNTIWSSNTALWSYAMVWNISWNENVGVWVSALEENVSWNENVAVWNFALQNNSTWSFSTAVWSNSLYFCYNCEKNTAFWAYSLESNSTWSYNTAVWYYALNSTKWSWNVALWYQAWANELGSNKLYIDNSNTATPLIYGDFLTNKMSVNGNLWIWVTDPTEALEVNWNIIADLPTANSHVATKEYVDNTVAASGGGSIPSIYTSSWDLLGTYMSMIYDTPSVQFLYYYYNLSDKQVKTLTKSNFLTDATNILTFYWNNSWCTGTPVYVIFTTSTSPNGMVTYTWTPWGTYTYFKYWNTINYYYSATGWTSMTWRYKKVAWGACTYESWSVTWYQFTYNSTDTICWTWTCEIR